MSTQKENMTFFRKNVHARIIPCEIWRGGTSRAIFILNDYLPANTKARDLIIKRIIGSQDKTRVDGLGGNLTHTSKVAVISKSSRKNVDVEFTIAQVSATEDLVDYSATCGNIVSAVGPFAIENNLVHPLTDGTAELRIYDTNTDTIIHVFVPIKEGSFLEEGSCFIGGVTFPTSEILVDFREMVGKKTDRILPTQHASEQIVLENGQAISISICDAGTPAVFIDLTQFLSLDPKLSLQEENPTFIKLIKEIRGKAAKRAGLVENWRTIDRDSPVIPEVMLITKPKAASADIQVQLITMNKLHASIGGGASICVAAAAKVPGSLVNSLIGKTLSDEQVLIQHPQGQMAIFVQTQPSSDPLSPQFSALAIKRSARLIMKGQLSIPIKDLPEDKSPQPVPQLLAKL